METKIIKSVYMYQDTTKKDLENFNDIKIKYPFDFITLILIVLAIAMFILDIIGVPFIWLLGVCLLVVAIVLKYRQIQKRRVAFLQKYEAAIENKSREIKNSINISATYPVYLVCDNDTKEFSLIYQETPYIKCSYDDIKDYSIAIDRFPTGKRLPDVPDKTIRSYVLTIEYQNKEKSEIGFSNANNKIKMKKSFAFQQYANTKSINKIAITLDRIIKKNRV